MKVWAAIVSHRHGIDHFMAGSHDGIRRKVARYVADNWDEAKELDETLPADPPEDDSEAISAYFDTQSNHGGGEYVDFFTPEEVE
jgi:hypothetical protein